MAAVGGKGWRSNFGQSVKFSMKEALEERNPAINGFLTSNQEFFNNIRETLRDLRKGQRRLDQIFNLDEDDRQLLELAKGSPGKVLEQLKSGNLRISEAEESKLMGFDDLDMEGDMGDFNMGDDDDIGTDDAMDDLKDLLGDIKDDTKNVTPMEKTAATIGQAQVASTRDTTKAVIGSAKLTANAISTMDKHNMESNNALMGGIASSNKLQANIAVSRAKLDQTLHNKTMEGLNAMNENLANMVEFNNNIIGKFTEQATQYYTDSLGELKKISATLERAYPVREKENRETTYGNLGLGTENVLNLSEYMKVLKSNFENTAVGSAISMVANPMMLGQILANPLGTILNSVVDSLIPKALDVAMREFNKTLIDFVPALLGKATRIGERSTNPVIQFLGELFGINPGATEKDIGKYEKGAVPFDGITHRTINVVIPTYLSQIVGLLGGAKNQVYDHRTGKFKNLENVKKEKEREREQDVRSAIGYDVYDQFSKALEDEDFGPGKDRRTEKARYEKGIANIIKAMAKSGNATINIHNKNELMGLLPEDGEDFVDDDILDFFVRSLKGTKDDKGRRRSPISARAQMRLSAAAHHYSDQRQRRFRYEDPADFLYDLVEQGWGEKKQNLTEAEREEEYRNEEQQERRLNLFNLMDVFSDTYQKERDKQARDREKAEREKKKKTEGGSPPEPAEGQGSPFGLGSILGNGGQKLVDINDTLKLIHKDTTALVNFIVGGNTGGPPVPPTGGPNPPPTPPNGGNPPVPPPPGGNPPPPNKRRPKLNQGWLYDDQTGKWRSYNNRHTTDEQRNSLTGFFVDNRGRWVYRGADNKKQILIRAKELQNMSEEEIINKLYGELLYSKKNASAGRISEIAGFSEEQLKEHQTRAEERWKKDKEAAKAAEIEQIRADWQKERRARKEKEDPERIEEERRESETFMDRLVRILKSPTEAMASALNSVNEGMYTLLFGEAAADEFDRPRGMIELIRDTLKEGFQGVVETISKEFWDPLKRLLFTDIENGGLWKSIKSSYNNFVQNLPWNQQEGTETIKSEGPTPPPAPNTGHAATGRPGFGFFGAPHFAKGRQGRLNQTGGKVLVNGRWRNASTLTDEERKAGTTGFYRDANGQWVMMHAGETEIVPAHKTAAGQKVDAKDENQLVISLYAKAMQLGNRQLMNQLEKLTDLTKEELEAAVKTSEATTKTAEETEKANKANDVEQRSQEKNKSNEKVKGVREHIKETMSDVMNNVSAHIFGDNKDENGKQKPVAEQIADMFAKGGRTLTKYFFGDNPDTNKPVEAYRDAFKKAVPAGIGRGIVIGGGLGLASMATALGSAHGFGLLGSIFLPGGPIGSMIVGIGAGLALENKQFREWLFGKQEVDSKGKPTGRRVGGKASDIANFFERNKKTILGGGALGLAQGISGVSIVGSLLSMIPGGGAIGFLPALGMGILGPVTVSIGAALALNSETFKRAMFGDLDEKTNKRVGNLISRQTMDDFRKHVPQIATGAAIGAGASFVIGNLPILGALALGPWNAAILGGAMGFMASSDKFRAALFGEQDENGNFIKGGLFDVIKKFIRLEITTPIRLFFKKEIVETKGWFKKKILEPLAFAFPIYKRALGKAFDSATRGIKTVFTKLGEKIEKALGPLGKLIRKFFVGMFDGMRKAMGGTFHNILTIARTLISSPVGLLTLPAKMIASNWRHEGTEEDKKFMEELDEKDVQRAIKNKGEYEAEKGALANEIAAHDADRKAGRDIGYRLTQEELDAKTEEWRKEQERREKEQLEREQAILDENKAQTEQLRDINANTLAAATGDTSGLPVPGSSGETGTANDVEKKDTTDTLSQNGNAPTTITSRIKSITKNMFHIEGKKLTGKKRSKSPESSSDEGGTGWGWGGGAIASTRHDEKKNLNAQANAIEAITTPAPEPTANSVEDKDSINRNNSKGRAENIIAQRKEDEYREKIIKALMTLKKGAGEAVKKTKGFFESLLDFLKGAAAFGGVLALLKLIKNLIGGGDSGTTAHDERAVRDLAHVVTRKVARGSVGRLLTDAARRKAAIKAGERAAAEEAEKAAKAAKEARRRAAAEKLSKKTGKSVEEILAAKAEKDAAKNSFLNRSKKFLKRNVNKGLEAIDNGIAKVGAAKETIKGYGKAAKGLVGSIGEDLYYGFRYGDDWRKLNKEWLHKNEQLNKSWLTIMEEKGKAVGEGISKGLDNLSKSIATKFQGTKTYVGTVFDNLKNGLGKAVEAVKGFAVDHAGKAVDYGKGMIDAAKQLPEVAGEQISAAKDQFGKAVDAAGGYIKSGVKKVADATNLTEVVEATDQIVVQPAKDAAKKAVGGFEWFVEKCKNAINAVGNNPSVKKILGNNSGKLTEKLMGALGKLNPKNFLSISGKVAKAVGKTSAMMGTAGLAQLAFSVYDAYSGANDAGELWGVADEDVTPGMRTAAVLLNVIMGLGPMVWVDLALEAIYLGSSMLNPQDPINIKRQILTWIYECLPDVNEEDLKKIDEARGKVDEEYTKYVQSEYIKAGGKSEEEFNAMSKEDQDAYIKSAKEKMEKEGKSVKSKDEFLHEKNKDKNVVLDTLRKTAIGKFLTGYNDEKGNFRPGLFQKLDRWFFGEEVTDENGNPTGEKKGGAWHKIKETAIWLGDKIWTVISGVAKFVDGLWDFFLNKSFDEKLTFLWKKVFFGGYDDEGNYQKAFIPDMIDKVCQFVTGIKDAVVKTGKEVWDKLSVGDFKGLAKMVLGFFGWEDDPEAEGENASAVSTITKTAGDFLSYIGSTIEGTIKFWKDFWDKFWSAPLFGDEGKNNGKWDVIKQMIFGLKPGENLLPGLWRKANDAVANFAKSVIKKMQEIKEWWDNFSLKKVLMDGLKKYLPDLAQAIEDTDKHDNAASPANMNRATGGGRVRPMKNIHPINGGGAMTMPSGGFKQTSAGVANTKLLDGSSMKDMGCGPTGVATALNSLGIRTDPNRTAATLSRSDMAANGTGVLPSGIAHMVNANGGNFTPIDPRNKRAIKAAQDAHLPLITGGSKADGISTSAGHYNVVIGNKTHDPLGRASRTVSADSISRTATSTDGKLGMLGVVTGGTGYAGPALLTGIKKGRYGGGAEDISSKVQEGINAYLGKTMDNGTVGCAEAVGKMGAYWSPFLKQMRDSGVVGVEGILGNAQQQGIPIVKYSDSALSVGDAVTYDDGTPRSQLVISDDGAHNNHIGVYSGMKDGEPFGADNSSGELKVVARPIHRSWQNPAWIIKTGDPNAKGANIGGVNGSSSGSNNNDGGISDFFSKLGTVTKDFAMSMLMGKEYTGTNFGNSSSSNSPGSSSGPVGAAPGKGRENIPRWADPHYVDVAERASNLSGIPTDWIWAQWANEAGRNFDSKLAKQNHNLAGVTVTSSMPGTVSGGMRWGLWNSDEEFADYWGGKYIKLWEGSTTAKTMKEYVHNIQNQSDGTRYCADPPEEEKYYGNMSTILGNQGTVVNGGGGNGNALEASQGFNMATTSTKPSGNVFVNNVTPKSTYMVSATDRYTRQLSDFANGELLSAIKQLDIHTEMRELIDIMTVNTKNQSVMNDNLKKAAAQMNGANATSGGGASSPGAKAAAATANEMKGASMPPGKPGGPNADMKRGSSGTNSYATIHAKNLEIAKGGSYSVFNGK